MLHCADTLYDCIDGLDSKPSPSALELVSASCGTGNISSDVATPGCKPSSVRHTWRPGRVLGSSESQHPAEDTDAQVDDLGACCDHDNCLAGWTVSCGVLPLHAVNV